MTPRSVLLGLVVASTALRLLWASGVGLSHDEAYHALFVRHPDLSYYDHPPMLALIAAAGLKLAPWLGPIVALRLGFILLFAGSTVILSRLTARVFGAWAGVLAAFVLNLTGYYGAAASTFALPDGPLLFFWLLTLDRLLAAIERPESIRSWIGVGLAWGGAMLSKYHAVFLPAGMVLYFLVDREARAWLKRPGPYLAVGIGAILFAPVVFWNATHGWGSFAFQGARAVGVAFRPDYLLAFLGGQALYLLPWMWLFLLAAAWRRVWTWSARTPAERLLLCVMAPPLLAFLAVGCVRPVLPHWSLVGFLAAMPLLGADWAAWRAVNPRRVARRLVVLSALVVVGVSFYATQARFGIIQRGGDSPLGFLPPRYDTSTDMVGWDQIAAELRRRGLLNRPETFVFTSRWYESGQLDFALGGRASVACYNASDAHGFAHWSRPEDWVGRDGILVLAHDSSTEPQVFGRWFEAIEPAGSFQVHRGGGPIREVRFYRCVGQTRPFPFDGRARRVAEADARTRR